MGSIKPDQFEQSLRSGKYNSIWLFDGPDRFLKERAVERLTKKVLPPESIDLNLSKYSGENSSAPEIVSTLQNLPFLADHRLIIVNATEEFSAADQKIISDGLSNAPTENIIVFLYDGRASLREAIPAQVSSLGNVVTFWTPFENQIPAWIINETKSRGKTISWDAARAMADASQNLQTLSNELDKLILYVGKKPQISFSDLLNFGLPDQAGDYFALEEAIWHRDLREALTQSRLLHDLGKRSESIFPIFERVFRNLILAHHYQKSQKMDLMNIYSALGFRGKLQQRKLEKGLRAYKQNEVNTSLKKVVQADYDLKTGQLPSQMAASLLIVDLLKA